MAVFTDPESLPAFRNPVLTVGTFDGVHSGHRVILEAVKQQARLRGGESILITFDPHPRQLLRPDETLQILTPLDEKIRLIREAGIDHLVVVPFTKAFSGLSAAAYVQEFLADKFHPACIVIGYDHHFGSDRKGSISLLREEGDRLSFEVVEIPAKLIQDAAVSSTKIRIALESGDVEKASALLGRHYAVTGQVVYGDQLGRIIGFPTANLKPNDKAQLIPASGVYACQANVSGQQYPAMLNIGYRPTVTNGKTLRIEAHLLDFSGDLYGQDMRLAFISRLRDEQRFSSLDALKEQLAADKANAAAMLR